MTSQIFTPDHILSETMIRAIILDFDGVILESVSIKSEAFQILFSSRPDHVKEIVDFHLHNGGMSRYDKFDYIYKNIYHEPLPATTKHELSEKFSQLIFEKLLVAPFVPGAKKFLTDVHSYLPVFVVSATPEEELKRIVATRGLTSFFARIYGSPRKKCDCIKEILIQEEVPPEMVIFVGDARNDYDAAQCAGVRFIGRVPPDEPDMFSTCQNVEKTVRDLNDLQYYIGACR